MSGNHTEPILTCSTENGYALAAFFDINASLKGRPVINFSDDKIWAENSTIHDQTSGTTPVVGMSYLHGDELSLKWSKQIPLADRNLSLMFQATDIKKRIGKVPKKETAKIFIFQRRDNKDEPFTGRGSSDKFVIYFSQGSGGNDREGLRNLQATRTKPERHVIKEPRYSTDNCITVPVKKFKANISQFLKCKLQTVSIRVFQDEQTGDGGYIITTDAPGEFSDGINEKYGFIPQSELSRMVGKKKQEIVTIGPSLTMVVKETIPPNQYSFDSDKITILSKMAGMSLEGTIRIFYMSGHHMCIAHRFGSFGECKLYLYNEYVAL